MTEGSGSIPLTNGSGSRMPKNIRIRRIRNTGLGLGIWVCTCSWPWRQWAPYRPRAPCWGRRSTPCRACEPRRWKGRRAQSPPCPPPATLTPSRLSGPSPAHQIFLLDIKQCYRVRIRIDFVQRDPDRDPGGQKLPTKIKFSFNNWIRICLLMINVFWTGEELNDSRKWVQTTRCRTYRISELAVRAPIYYRTRIFWIEMVCQDPPVSGRARSGVKS